MTSLVISIAILLIIVTFAVNTGFENIQRAKIEAFRNDASIIGQVIEEVRLKIETFPEAQKNSYLSRLTLNTEINESELNNYLTRLEFKLSEKENLNNICAEYYSGDAILLPNKKIIYMGKDVRIVKEI